MKQTTESDAVEFGIGALSLAFRVHGGAGSTTTVPWSLILNLAQEFRDRALRGVPTGFRAVVNGPLGTNVMGEVTWIEVVLAAAGEVFMDGLWWSIY